MRIALALAAVLAFAAAPCAQSLQDDAPAVDTVVSEAPAVLAPAAEAAPALTSGVDLSAHVAPSTVDVADVDVQDARRDGVGAAYVGSMVVATAALLGLAYLFI
ncbi:hypothetical protein [Rubrivirga sp. IMCC45206]|uniref:hypothetical protein n=1 Tax=Rubrivirga sp. IMCC45206 TaxID=3391614 RepID=UPI00398FA989